MPKFEEKRDFFRMRIDCEIHCRLLNNTDEVYIARCTSLSGAGVSFTTDQELHIGDELEITIRPRHAVTPPMNGLIKIIRILKTDDNMFEVGASMTVLHDN